MLKEFRFSNFGSFREEAVLSMEAVGLKEMKSVPRKEGGDSLLPLAAIYGKNGGGKTNVLWAFGTAIDFILNAQQSQHESATIPVKPFLLDEQSIKNPTTFDFEYRLDGVRYWYGFSATREKIFSEYLYHSPNGQKACVFSRNGQTFEFTKQKKKRSLIAELVSKNQLFFSVASAANDEDCKRAMRWFRKYLLNGNNYENIEEQLALNANNPEIIKFLVDYAKSADTGIEKIDIDAQEMPIKGDHISVEMPVGIPEEIRQFLTALSNLSNLSDKMKVLRQRVKAVSYHRGIDADGHAKLFPLTLSDESNGTRRLMALVPAIALALERGGVFIMDELETGMHPALVKMILSKFQNPASNPKNAQLIFTTHSAELLDMSILRKDQIYLADKSRKTGASILYSVSDFSTPTRENIRKAYLVGKYGAAPDIKIEEVE